MKSNLAQIYSSFLVWGNLNFMQEAMVDPKSDERRTPLFMAAENGAFDAVTLLMERGADVTIRDTELRSVLHVAVGHPRVIENLLQVS